MRPPTQRFLSLDVFRGMTICFMIIVNTPGSGAVPYAPLLHAGWHGFTPTDLVFPSLLPALLVSFLSTGCSRPYNGCPYIQYPYFRRFAKNRPLLFFRFFTHP